MKRSAVGPVVTRADGDWECTLTAIDFTTNGHAGATAHANLMNGQVALALHDTKHHVVPLCWPIDGGARCGSPWKTGPGETHDHTKDPRGIGKTPLIPWSAEGSKGANRGRLQSFFRKWPTANVGIVLEESRLVHIDPDSEEAWAEVQKLGAPSTVLRQSRNPSYLYRAPEECPLARTTHKGQSGQIDVMSEGIAIVHGQHRTGAAIYLDVLSYADMEFADAPDWAIELLREAEARKVTSPPADDDPDEPPVRLRDLARATWRGQRVVDKGGRIVERDEQTDIDRSGTLFLIGCDLAKAGATRHTIIDALAERDATLGYEKFSDRGDEGEAEYARIADKVLDESRLAKTVPLNGRATIPPGVNGHTPSLSANGASDKPELDAGDDNLPRITGLALDALIRANDPPYLFRHAGAVRLEHDDNDAIKPVELTVDRARYEMARVASWTVARKVKDSTTRQTEVVRVPAKPPLDVVRDLLATPDLPFPILTRIVDAPIVAADGTICARPGYHPGTRVFYAPAPGVVIPPIPDNPTADDVKRARALFLDDVFVDFPFREDADRAHAFCLTIEPFARELIDGPTPQYLSDASTPGSGKGLSVQAALRPSLGARIGMMTQPTDDEEFRKKITTCILEARGAVIIDNITRPLDSGTHASAITTPTWEDRFLGTNRLMALPIRHTWVACGNNVVLSTEMARRTVRIRLAPDQERPWRREQFKHPALLEWIDEHRGELIAAALTLIRAWIVRGKPAPGVKPLGSFESWTRVLGGILETAGVPGFLENVDVFYEEADHETAILRNFVSAWYERYGHEKVGTSQLFPIADDQGDLDLGENGPRSRQTALGMLLGKHAGKVLGDLRITSAGIEHHAKMWRLLPVRGLVDEAGEKKGNLGNLREPFAIPATRVREKVDSEISVSMAGVEKVPNGSLGSPGGSDFEDEVIE